MTISDMMLDISKKDYKPYYIFTGPNKYVRDKYLEKMCNGRYTVVSYEQAYVDIQNTNLFEETSDEFCVMQAENDGHIKTLIDAPKNKRIIMLYHKLYKDDNTINFTEDLGKSEIDKFAKNNNFVLPCDIKSCKWDLFKIMKELEKIPILNNSNVRYDFSEDILPIDIEKPDELKLCKFEYSDTLPNIYSVMNNLIKCIQVADNKGKSIDAIKKTTGIENEKMIWLFQKYTPHDVNTYINLFDNIYNLYEWIKLGFPTELIEKTVLYYFIHEERRTHAA